MIRPREFYTCELLLSPEKLAALDGSKSLAWWPEIGIGYYPVEEGTAPYDHDYFAKYASMAQTEMGRDITLARIELVEKFWRGPVIDIGIGSGQFVHQRSKDYSHYVTRGYDVNPSGVEWLKSRGLWSDPYNPATEVEAITFWDVLEHIRDIGSLVSRVSNFVFVSIPIFRNENHARGSKHFRRDEHCWYFTPHGICALFSHLGFECFEANRREVELGREDIGTFVFHRRQNHRPHNGR